MDSPIDETISFGMIMGIIMLLPAVSCSNSHDIPKCFWTTAEYICNKNASEYSHSMDRAFLLGHFDWQANLRQYLIY